MLSSISVAEVGVMLTMAAGIAVVVGFVVLIVVALVIEHRVARIQGMIRAMAKDARRERQSSDSRIEPTISDPAPPARD